MVTLCSVCTRSLYQKGRDSLWSCGLSQVTKLRSYLYQVCIYIVIGQDSHVNERWPSHNVFYLIYIHAHMHHNSSNDLNTYSVSCHFTFRTSGPGVAIQPIARALHFFFPHQHHLHQPPALCIQVCKRRSQCIKRTECQQQHSSYTAHCNSSVKHSNKCLRFTALCGIWGIRVGVLSGAWWHKCSKIH